MAPPGLMALPPAAAVSSPPDAEAIGAPTPEIIGYARRLLIRQYHAPAQDIDDLIAQALLDFVTVARAGRPCQDGLFLVIVRRRACDYWRKRHSDLPLDAARNVGYTLDDTRLQGQIIQRRLARATLSKGHLAKGRLHAITERILAGSSFSEACEASGIPRGSRERYRHTLRGFIEDLVAGRSAPTGSFGPKPSFPKGDLWRPHRGDVGKNPRLTRNPRSGPPTG